MAKCKHYVICGLDAEDTVDGLCILHTGNPEKDEGHFNELLAAHRGGRGDEFSHFVFPGEANFRNEKFGHGADFTNAIFAGGVDFTKAKLTGRAKFDGCVFKEWAEFAGVKFLSCGVWFDTAKFLGRAVFTLGVFKNRASFSGVELLGEADFSGAQFIRSNRPTGGEFTFIGSKFAEEAIFVGAQFTGEVDFSIVTFAKGARFHGVTFGPAAKFQGASFLGRTSFVAPRTAGGSKKIFADAEVDFRETILEPLDALIFRDADLRSCRFQGTDLRKALITEVVWPETIDRCLGFKIRRKAVYDESFLQGAESHVLAFLRSFLPGSFWLTGKEPPTQSWPHVERLYRELKQNYKDRREYVRASDFHYGRKEMLRKNPETNKALRFLITLYWLVSGYGERWIRPLIWAAVVLLLCALSYLCLGLNPKSEGPVLRGDNGPDWLEALLYSFRVMTLLKPDDFAPVGLAGKLVYAFQSLAGPILLGLSALAIRQKLKR